MHDDYSWYASSELAALSTTPGGYRTFQMPPNTKGRTIKQRPPLGRCGKVNIW